MEVLLRPVEPADVDVFFAQQQEAEAVRRANFPARTADQIAVHWRDRILGDDTVQARTVCVGDQVAGYVVAWWEDGHRYVGYWLGRDFWGRGAGTAALTRFLTLEATRPLYADTDIGNIASQRVLERCGFRRIETRRNPDAEYVIYRLD
jgi:RimJ/RimL family protein N-acetyltransferase